MDSNRLKHSHSPKRKICIVEGCTKFCIRGDKCRVHAEPSNKCAMKGCRKDAIHDGYCKCHQMEGSSSMNTNTASSPSPSPSPPPLPPVSQKVVFVPVPMPMFPPSTLGYNPAMFAYFNQHGAASFFNPHANHYGFGQPTTDQTDDDAYPVENLNGLGQPASQHASDESAVNLNGSEKPASCQASNESAVNLNAVSHHASDGPAANFNGFEKPTSHQADDKTVSHHTSDEPVEDLEGSGKPTSRHTSNESAANDNGSEKPTSRLTTDKSDKCLANLNEFAKTDSHHTSNESAANLDASRKPATSRLTSAECLAKLNEFAKTVSHHTSDEPVANFNASRKPPHESAANFNEFAKGCKRLLSDHTNDKLMKSIRITADELRVYEMAKQIRESCNLPLIADAYAYALNHGGSMQPTPTTQTTANTMVKSAHCTAREMGLLDTAQQIRVSGNLHAATMNGLGQPRHIRTTDTDVNSTRDSSNESGVIEI